MLEQDYLKVFNELFFDVDKNQQVKEIIEEVNGILGCLIVKFGEVLNEILSGVNRQDDIVDTVVILFIRKIIEQLDAINVLMSVCSFTQAQVILRSLIENSVSLKFILKEDTKKRAASYFLERHYQELELADKYYNENNQLGELLKNISGEEEFKKTKEKIDKKKKALESLIASKSIFQQVAREREEKLNKKNRKKGYIQWYEVCSTVDNLYKLMKDLGYQDYYKAIYGGFSNEVHGLNASIGMEISVDGINLKHIRNPEHGDSILSITSSLSLSALKAVYSYLKDGEEEKKEFGEFYMSFREKRDNVIKDLKKLY